MVGTGEEILGETSSSTKVEGKRKEKVGEVTSEVSLSADATAIHQSESVNLKQDPSNIAFFASLFPAFDARIGLLCLP